MILPKQVKIGGHVFKVIYPYKFKEMSLAGQICHSQNEIRISKTDGNGQ